MTRDQRVGLSLIMRMLDFQISQLEKTEIRAAETIAAMPSRGEAMAFDIAARAGTYMAAVTFAAPELRALYIRLRQLFPKIDPL